MQQSLRAWHLNLIKHTVHNKWWDPPRSALERQWMLGCGLSLISNSHLETYQDKLKIWCVPSQGLSSKPLNLYPVCLENRGCPVAPAPNLWPQIPLSVLRNSGRRAPLLSSLSPQLRWRQEPPPQWFQPQKKQGPQQLPGCWNDRLKWTLENMEL